MDLTKVDDSIIRLWEKYGPQVLGLGVKILIAALIIICAKIIISVSARLINRAVTGKIHLDETFASIIGIVIKYAVIIIGLIMILDILGVNTTGLLALLGAAGVAIGFALKDTLGNIASGIIILFLRPFQKGDFIECGGITGAVREIGLFSSELETADGVYISAPNSSLWGVPLKNFSRNSRRRMDITVCISYTDSVDTAFDSMNEIIAEESRFLKDPPAQVMANSLGESGIGITLRAWVSGADYWRVYWDQVKNVKEKIQAAGLSIALPKREIRIIKDNAEIS